MKPISLDEREVLKRNRLAEALYETWAQEMRLHGAATTRRWVELPSVDLHAWGVVAQLATEGRDG